MTSMRLAIAIMVSVGALSSGCSSCSPTMTLTFRVVDADTRAPLREVSTTRKSENRVIRLLPIGQEGKNETVPLTATGQDGLVKARLCHNQSHGFTFEKSGYRRAWADLLRTSTMGTVVQLRSALSAAEPASGSILRPRGIIVVPLHADPE